MKIAKRVYLEVSDEQGEKIWEVSRLLTRLYNCALEQRITAYKMQKKTINVYEQKREILQIKKELPEYHLPFGRLLHECLIRLDRSYNNFFRIVKLQGKGGCPRFQSRNKFFSQPIEKQHITIKEGYFYYKFGRNSSLAPLKLKMSEGAPENYGMVILCNHKNKFYLSFSTEKEEEKARGNNEVIGIDLGIKRMVTGVSTTGKVYFSKSRSKTLLYFDKIKDEIRSKRDKCKKYSRRWKYLTKKLSLVYDICKDKMEDFLHKLTYKLANKFVERTLVIGDLVQQEMVQKEKTRLNRMVQNNWYLGNFINKLSYKCKLYGKELIKISERYTSKTCSNCGYVKDMPLSVRVYECPKCQLKIDRDLNSSINILNRFLAQSGRPFNYELKIKNYELIGDCFGQLALASNLTYHN